MLDRRVCPAIAPRFRADLSAHGARVLSFGEKASSDLLILHDQDAFLCKHRYFPEITTRRIALIGWQPVRDASLHETMRLAHDHIEQVFGCSPSWFASDADCLAMLRSAQPMPAALEGRPWPMVRAKVTTPG